MEYGIRNYDQVLMFSQKNSTEQTRDYCSYVHHISIGSTYSVVTKLHS